MTDITQHLIDETERQILATEQEIKDSDEELEILKAKLKVEKKTLEMEDLNEDLKEDFKYSAEALEGMVVMEENKNSELKKDLKMLKYRKAVLKSQFSDFDFSR